MWGFDPRNKQARINTLKNLCKNGFKDNKTINDAVSFVKENVKTTTDEQLLAGGVYGFFDTLNKIRQIDKSGKLDTSAPKKGPYKFNIGSGTPTIKFMFEEVLTRVNLSALKTHLNDFECIDDGLKEAGCSGWSLQTIYKTLSRIEKDKKDIIKIINSRI